MKAIDIYNSITLRESQILASRMMGDTLEKLGKEYGVTRERIGEIELKAFRKIVKAIMFASLDEYINKD